LEETHIKWEGENKNLRLIINTFNEKNKTFIPYERYYVKKALFDEWVKKFH
jgi:hypothetical protein